MAGLDHSVKAYTDEAAEFVEEFGGKMGGLEFIKRRAPELAEFILPAINVKSGQGMPNKDVLRAMAGDARLIDRGSHWMDMQGMVDVFRTSVVSVDQVAGEIERIRAEALSAKVTEYGKYENPAYDGRDVVVGVQPYMPGRRGSIVDHPNQEGKYVISLVEERFLPKDYDTYLYDEKGERVQTFHNDGGRGFRAQKLIDIHRRIRDIGLFRDDVSFQMEFNADGPYIFQARAFLPKRLADFAIPQRRGYGSNRLCFGVTPEEGLLLPVVHLVDGEGWNNDMDLKDGWANFKTYHGEIEQGRNPLLKFQPRNMKAYLASSSFYPGGGMGKPTLEHNHFACAQKADVTVIENVGENALNQFAGRYEHTEGEGPANVMVRVICDGVRDSVEIVD